MGCCQSKPVPLGLDAPVPQVVGVGKIDGSEAKQDAAGVAGAGSKQERKDEVHPGAATFGVAGAIPGVKQGSGLKLGIAGEASGSAGKPQLRLDDEAKPEAAQGGRLTGMLGKASKTSQGVASGLGSGVSGLAKQGADSAKAGGAAASGAATGAASATAGATSGVASGAVDLGGRTASGVGGAVQSGASAGLAAGQGASATVSAAGQSALTAAGDAAEGAVVKLGEISDGAVASGAAVAGAAGTGVAVAVDRLGSAGGSLRQGSEGALGSGQDFAASAGETVTDGVDASGTALNAAGSAVVKTGEGAVAAVTDVYGDSAAVAVDAPGGTSANTTSANTSGSTGGLLGAFGFGDRSSSKKETSADASASDSVPGLGSVGAWGSSLQAQGSAGLSATKDAASATGSAVGGVGSDALDATGKLGGNVTAAGAAGVAAVGTAAAMAMDQAGKTGESFQAGGEGALAAGQDVSVSIGGVASDGVSMTGDAIGATGTAVVETSEGAVAAVTNVAGEGADGLSAGLGSLEGGMSGSLEGAPTDVDVDVTGNASADAPSSSGGFLGAFGFGKGSASTENATVGAGGVVVSMSEGQPSNASAHGEAGEGGVATPSVFGNASDADATLPASLASGAAGSVPAVMEGGEKEGKGVFARLVDAAEDIAEDIVETAQDAVEDVVDAAQDGGATMGLWSDNDDDDGAKPAAATATDPTYEDSEEDELDIPDASAGISAGLSPGLSAALAPNTPSRERGVDLGGTAYSGPSGLPDASALSDAVTPMRTTASLGDASASATYGETRASEDSTGPQTPVLEPALGMVEGPVMQDDGEDSAFLFGGSLNRSLSSGLSLFSRSASSMLFGKGGAEEGPQPATAADNMDAPGKVEGENAFEVEVGEVEKDASMPEGLTQTPSTF